MHWREQVAKLECGGNFDIAVFLLEKVVQDNPGEMDAYIFLLFRLREMWLECPIYWSNISRDALRDVKKDYYDAKFESYMLAAQKYFAESYDRFSKNSEYLYYASHILGHISWYFGVSDDFQADLEHRAMHMHYNTIFNMMSYYESLYYKEPKNVNVIQYATDIVNDSSIQGQLVTKGAAGEYVLGRHVAWARRVLKDAEKNGSID